MQQSFKVFKKTSHLHLSVISEKHQQTPQQTTKKTDILPRRTRKPTKKPPRGPQTHQIPSLHVSLNPCIPVVYFRAPCPSSLSMPSAATWSRDAQSIGGRTNETNTSGEEIRKAKKVEELSGMSFEGDLIKVWDEFRLFSFWMVGCVLVEHAKFENERIVGCDWPNLKLKYIYIYVYICLQGSRHIFWYF